MNHTHDCHVVHCRNNAELSIVGIVPKVAFTNGSTYPSQGPCLLGYSCREHAETTVAYFTRLGHLEVGAKEAR